MIDAFQYTRAYYEEVFGTPQQPTWMLMYPTFATIQTLEGEMRAQMLDWIITGVNGEHYPCKPDIFAATYEAVEE